MNEPTLLPCPFCGGAVNASDCDRGENNRIDVYSVVCLTCDAEGPGGATAADAIAAWNRRAPSSESAVSGSSGTEK